MTRKTVWDVSLEEIPASRDDRLVYLVNRARITLEIPHQGKPLAWFATDEEDFRDKLIGSFTGSEEESFYELLHEGVGDEDPVNEVTTDQLLDIASSDLQKFEVFDTLDEARNYALVGRGQGFSKVYKLLNDWDLFIFQISIKENDLTVYDHFTGNDDVSDKIYSMLSDDQHLATKILGVDFVSTNGSVLSEVTDLDIESWQEEIWGEEA